ncbi:hypothetical protein [Nocardia donostiensis]|uniref:Uncharacterized protein n=1 Tax=Nocardia donostiensis TaxID=1538463 RepID=A0A1W0BNY9_9NOCA|nr:hypothetical protein [Nocardia donostiensis]ONM47627.1 hypothetical protein B0T46_17195 [Nocardia donostiensis]OQS15028.1 hypothetical protein B0T36_10105 [Nocardia donostiensis]OQS24201.1 hypothetical protein B0T44_00840 [Nocardia donostiensis]
MNKIRTFGLAFAAAAGLMLAGAGVAAAEPDAGGGTTPVDTGSAEIVTSLVELLATGSSGADTTPAD